jgi:hypothetical protein
MLILRYYFWAVVYHMTTFYRQHPLVFVRGLVMLPWHFARSTFSSIPDQTQVISGVNFLEEGILNEWIPKPLESVWTRFENLRNDAIRAEANT